MITKLLGIVGELLLASGLILGGFIGWYQLQETQIGQEQAAEAEELEVSWAEEPDGGFQAEEGWVEPDLGSGFAVLRIPKLGDDYQRVIAEGVGGNVMNDRKTGVGRYPGTGMPGELGNFALAAHRLGNGGPFLRVDELDPGDEVFVSAGMVTWVYEVTRLDVVLPTQVEVLESVPGKRELTMTTCHPMYQWHERLIVKAELVRVIEGDRVTEAEDLDQPDAVETEGAL